MYTVSEDTRTIITYGVDVTNSIKARRAHSTIDLRFFRLPAGEPESTAVRSHATLSVDASWEDESMAYGGPVMCWQGSVVIDGQTVPALLRYFTGYRVARLSVTC